MYNLPYHKEKNDEIVKQFIDAHPFAFLTGCDAENKPVATQIPIFIEQDGASIRSRRSIARCCDCVSKVQQPGRRWRAAVARLGAG